MKPEALRALADDPGVFVSKAARRMLDAGQEPRLVVFSSRERIIEDVPASPEVLREVVRTGAEAQRRLDEHEDALHREANALMDLPPPRDERREYGADDDAEYAALARALGMTDPPSLRRP